MASSHLRSCSRRFSLDVGGSTRNQPQRIIVETASDVGVALLGERLVLMVCASVLKLCCGDVEDALLARSGIG